MKIVALTGGVGGAKLIFGLANLLSPDDLTIIVNTGDDFEHYGLHISPDLDTVCYALANLQNSTSGWGRENETFHFLHELERLGGEHWFKLGDKDLATHVERTKRLKDGKTLAEVTSAFCSSWGVEHKVLPMSNQQVRTTIETIDLELLPFQEYFVHLRCEPRITRVIFSGVENARPAPGVIESIQDSDAVIICPSNPFVSIDPILSIPLIRSLLLPKRVIAVSPIIGMDSIKGPAAKMFSELGIKPSAASVADHYQSFLTGIVMAATDEENRKEIQKMGITPFYTDIMMPSRQAKRRLAKSVLEFMSSL